MFFVVACVHIYTQKEHYLRRPGGGSLRLAPIRDGAGLRSGRMDWRHHARNPPWQTAKLTELVFSRTEEDDAGQVVLRKNWTQSFGVALYGAAQALLLWGMVKQTGMVNKVAFHNLSLGGNNWKTQHAMMMMQKGLDRHI